MNIKCNREALFEAVQLASSIVPTRTPKPILQCAKLETGPEDQELIVIATDNEMTIRYVVSHVQVEAPGATVVSAERLSGILRETKDKTICLEASGETCEIVGQDSRFRLRVEDPEDFPVIKVSQEEGGLRIKAGVLKEMFRKVSFAVARESSQYALNGVLWEQRDKKLRMVATDGRRLAQVDGEVIATGKTAEQQAAIVPIKVINSVGRILHDLDEEVQVGLIGNQVVIRTAAVEICGILVQGRFPNYKEVIPSEADKKVTFKVEALQSALRRAALLTNEHSRGVALSFSDEQVRFSSSTPEAGEAEIDITLSDYHSDAVEIGFNPQYLLEMLRIVDEDEVTFEFSDGKKPGLLRCGKSFLYVVMPVTV